MKKRGYVINYILLLVCILTSLNHVESYKTMIGQMSYLDAQSRDNATSIDDTTATANNSRTDYIRTIGYITSADACTEEMLESAHSNLLNRTLAVRQNEIRAKDGARSESIKAEGALQNANQFYIFADLCAKITGTDTAGVIRFIHNKDGKKEI